MSTIARVAIVWITAFSLVGCGGKQGAIDADIAKDIQKDKADEERTAKIEKQQRQQQVAQEQAEQRREHDEKAASAQEQNSQQEQRAKLCAELFRDVMPTLKVTPSESVKRILGDNYTVELRSGGDNNIDLRKLRAAIDGEQWLELLSILEGEHITKYPDEVELIGIRARFLSHRFIAFVKTGADLSRTRAISLTEGRPIIGNYTSEDDYIYINGNPFRGLSGDSEINFYQWERHPDGTGWYCDWRPMDGELIILLLPATDPRDPRKFGMSERATEGIWPTLVVEPIPAAMSGGEEIGVVPTLKKRYELGEITAAQMAQEIDKACRERFIARRKAALAL